MGRYFYNKKDAVEDHKAITISALLKMGVLQGGVKRGLSYSSSGLKWTRGGEPSGSISFSIDLTPTAGTMHLKYSYEGYGSSDKEHLNYPVQLVTSPCHYGGVRWLFICPCQNCGRRVGVLYLAGKYAACRHCYDLTYQSCQDSHKFDGMALMMGLDPRAWSRMMNRIGKE